MSGGGFKVGSAAVPNHLWERHASVDARARWPWLQVGKPPLTTQALAWPRRPQVDQLLNQAVYLGAFICGPIGRPPTATQLEEATRLNWLGVRW